MSQLKNWWPFCGVRMQPDGGRCIDYFQGGEEGKKVLRLEAIGHCLGLLLLLAFNEESWETGYTC